MSAVLREELAVQLRPSAAARIAAVARACEARRWRDALLRQARRAKKDGHREVVRSLVNIARQDHRRMLAALRDVR